MDPLKIAQIQPLKLIKKDYVCKNRAENVEATSNNMLFLKKAAFYYF